MTTRKPVVLGLIGGTEEERTSIIDRLVWYWGAGKDWAPVDVRRPARDILKMAAPGTEIDTVNLMAAVEAVEPGFFRGIAERAIEQHVLAGYNVVVTGITTKAHLDLVRSFDAGRDPEFWSGSRAKVIRIGARLTGDAGAWTNVAFPGEQVDFNLVNWSGITLARQADYVMELLS